MKLNKIVQQVQQAATSVGDEFTSRGFLPFRESTVRKEDSEFRCGQVVGLLDVELSAMGCRANRIGMQLWDKR